MVGATFVGVEEKICCVVLWEVVGSTMSSIESVGDLDSKVVECVNVSRVVLTGNLVSGGGRDGNLVPVFVVCVILVDVGPLVVGGALVVVDLRVATVGVVVVSTISVSGVMLIGL